MQRVAVINVVGLTSGLIGSNTPRIKAFADRHRIAPIDPAFPAVTCVAQSNYLTGKRPCEHGIVGNGWYDRAYSEPRFWKQSNRLASGPKIWDELRDIVPGFTCAKLFWWFNMYATVDYSITPRPMYPADGRKVFDIYTGPMNLRETIKKDLGEFPFHAFWGPRAGIESSKWIAESAMWIEKRHKPTLTFVYLPHLDYNLQRLGPSHPEIRKDLTEIDTLVGELIDCFDEQSVQVALLSEYGVTDVENPIHINRAFREKGWLAIKNELGLEQLDCGASKVFALSDHQVAHIYLNDHNLLDDVRSHVESLPGIARVLDREAQQEQGINHSRSGDLIAVSDEGSWFTYYYWLDDTVAPDFARCVDIHRKPGYDPVELFVNPHLKFPAAKVAAFLAKKKLGFRAMLDIIPLDASLVRGSHGCRPNNQQDWPVFIGPTRSKEPLESTSIYRELLKLVTESS